MNSRTRSGRKRLLLGIASLVLATVWVGCSPVYVVKAGLAEARILRGRRPIHEVLADTAVDAATRAKLSWVVAARRFASEDLGIAVGASYTMYTQLDRDTLALVVTAAHQDRLVPKTWWFPIVGTVPYKGHFSLASAQKEEAGLLAKGFDTYVRPTAAFSTLGWFNDPILSTALQTDDVEIVTTVLHELSHQHLFVPGHVGFNESFATFVGRTGAVRFFCTREGGGADSIKCARARARWRDFQRFSDYLNGFVAELETLYDDPRLTREDKLAGRARIFEQALKRFDAQVAPGLEEFTFAGFRDTPLNNATLLSRIRYYDRLADFEALLQQHGGDLVAVLSELKARAGSVNDPFELLPSAAPAPGS